ncbi:MAG: hypothetical protein IOB84_08130 [Brevundimonas sp.]|nr:hypothetical protein [Brevundimonas sp.]
MRPARQGDFDGLCGLYALINALDPAAGRRPRTPMHRDLFVALVHALPRRKLGQAMDVGLGSRDLIDAATAAFPLFKKRLGGHVSVMRPFKGQVLNTDADFLEAISDIMASGRSAIILNVHTPTFRHWTVAETITAQDILIRDSWALKALSRTRYTVKRGPYRIHPSETLMVHFRPLRRLARDDG